MRPVKLTEWESHSEMLDKLRHKALLTLKTSVESPWHFYNVDLPDVYHDFAVVIFSTGHKRPSGIWLEPPQKILLMCDGTIFKIDLATRKIEYSKKVTTTLYEFLEFQSTGACIALHELGLVSLLPDGTEIWRADTGIIEDFRFKDDDRLVLKIMDEDSVEINLRTGAVT